MPGVPYAAATRRSGPMNPFEKYKESGSVGPKDHPYVPTELEAEFLRELYMRYMPDSRGTNHYAFHRQWWTNMAFFLGMQWLQWNDTLGRMEETKRPSWRRYYTANRIFTAVLRTHSKLVADEAVGRLAPKSTDREDINAAQAAEDMLDHLREVVDYDAIRSEAILWAIICGSGFVKLWWDPNEGDIKTVDDGSGKLDSAPIGELCGDSSGPLSIRVPTNVTKMRYMPWLIHLTVRSMEYVHEHFPEKAYAVVPDVQAGYENWLEDRIANIVGQAGVVSPQFDEPFPNMVRIISMWTRPSPAHPNGMYGMVANGIPLFVATEGPKLINPYADLGCPIPFIHYPYATVPGRLWGMSLVEQMIPPQREYNIARSQIIENKDLMSRPKWLVPKGHGIPATSINSAPGEVIEYNASLPKPEQVDIKPLPNYVMDHIQACKLEMDDISAQQEVTQAKAPASIRSGVAIQLLQAADNAVLAFIKRTILRGDRDCYRAMLQIASKMYKEPRVIALLGKDNLFQVQALLGSDLKGHTKVRIFAEGGMLESKAARQQNVLDYVQTGILNPQDPDEKMSILAALEMGDVRTFVKERLIDERMAEFENQQMGNAEQPMFGMAQEWEDHEVHIKRHNLFRKSVEFKLLPQQQQDAIGMHVFQHQQYMMQQVMAMQQQQESQRGGPGEKGQQSEPGDRGSPPEAKGNPANDTGGSSE